MKVTVGENVDPSLKLSSELRKSIQMFLWEVRERNGCVD